MVPIKNATAIITAVTQNRAVQGVLQNVTAAAGEPATAAVYFEQTTPAEMFKDFGVELREPAYLMVEISDAAKFAPNSRVEITMNGAGGPLGTYFVQGQPEVHQAFNDADHADIYLDKFQYVVVS